MFQKLKFNIQLMYGVGIPCPSEGKILVIDTVFQNKKATTKNHKIRSDF